MTQVCKVVFFWQEGVKLAQRSLPSTQRSKTVLYELVIHVFLWIRKINVEVYWGINFIIILKKMKIKKHCKQQSFIICENQ